MMTTADLAARWGLRRTGRDWRGTCPACGYRDTLVLSVGRTGSPVAWCASCQDHDGLHALLRDSGAVPSAQMVTHDTTRRAREVRTRERAMAIWESAVPAAATPADTYLTARGLPGLAASPALRYRADAPHPDGSRYPAMIAVVSGATGATVAIHRTYLRRDGARKADVDPQRATLGPIWGGAVRLDPVAPELVIGEGIESSASASRVLRLPAWAAISAGNLAKGLLLPRDVRSVVIAADNDPRARNGQHPGQDAADAAARRWRGEGRRVRIATPHREGADFNDVLREATHG